MCIILLHTHHPPNGRSSSTIDIAINKNFPHITLINAIPDLDSDHDPIVFEIFERVVTEPNKKIILFKDTNRSKFRLDLERLIKLNDEIGNENERNREIEGLVAAVQSATDQNSRLVDANLYRNGLRQEIRDLIAERNRARR